MGKLTGFVVVASVIGALLFQGVAQAQYAAPIGSVQATAATFSTGVGGDVPITGTVRSSTGAPVANATVTGEIVSEPGGPNGDAAIGSKVTTRVTDAFGQAMFNLRVGSTPGVIVVRVSSATGLSSSVIINVVAPASYIAGQPTAVNVVTIPVAVPVAAAQPSAAAPVLPPAAPVDRLDVFISPPNTGDAGLAAPASGTLSPTVLVLAVLAIMAAGGTLSLLTVKLAIRSQRTDGR